MNFLNEVEIEKLEERLLKVIEGEYPGGDELYLAIDKIEIIYIDVKPTVAIYVTFGRHSPNGSSNDNWQQEIELAYSADNLDFIAGQLFQAIIDKGL